MKINSLLAAIFCAAASISWAQSYDLTPDDGTVRGFVSEKVPDGNYKVTVTLGAPDRAASTTIRAENRRLMLENVATKPGETKTLDFVVNKRNVYYGDSLKVKLKAEEDKYFTWDDELTIEITGENPAVRSITVEPDTTARTIFLCGNSTVVDQFEEPWASWGQMIPRWFDNDVAIANYAHSGLCAEVFIAQGRLAKITELLRPGDYVVVEFGHNDQKQKGPGKGAWYNFSTCLKIFVDEVRAKGGEVIFCTPTQRRIWMEDNATIRETHGDYPAAMLAVAERENVPVIDLHQMTREFFESLGFEDSKRALVHYPANTFIGQTKELADNTHFNPFGAYEVAKMVVEGIRKLDLPLAKSVRPDYTSFDPAHPDDPSEFVWTLSSIQSMEKPAGN